MEQFLRGIPASGGIAIGEAAVFLKSNLYIPKYTIDGDRQSVESEIDKLENALLKTRNELERLKQDLSKTALETGYLDSTILMLEDPTLKKRVAERIQQSYLNIEWIFNEVIQEMAFQLEQSDNTYFQERAPDVISLGQKVLKNLMGKQELQLPETANTVIVVAHTLSPHEIVTLYRKHVGGFVTEIGGKTSHVAIMARDLQVPAVVGIPDVTRLVNTGEEVVVDGRIGTVIIDPREDTRALYRFKEREQRRHEERLKRIEKRECALKSGEKVQLLANMDLEEEIDLVRQCGCTGIGLFRTEYIFLNREQPPGEDEQYRIYRDVVEAMRPYPVTIRVIDIGGDKRPTYTRQYQEQNPFLGLRGIRYVLAHRDLLYSQIRAILRASAHGKTRIMFPMVNDLDELSEVLSVLKECMGELRSREVPFDKGMLVGAMIETPACVLLLDRIVDMVDFISVGTNDLIQYTLAIDRGNGMVASEFDPAHPAILRSLKIIAETVINRPVELSICGEMAGDPLYTLLLIGLGYRVLSMGVNTIPVVKSIIIQSTREEAEEVAFRILSYPLKTETSSYLRREMIARFKELEDYFR
ncbi:MAG: phosphoenolpyruvate--protein phosphotransferase [Spirochaetota bacterium]